MTKNKILLLIAFLAISFSVSAQTAAQVLNSLTFEAPKALYHPKGNTANMRTQPSTKAKKAELLYDCWLPNSYIVNDEGDNAAWVTAKVEGKTVYLSKSVMTKVEPEPFMVNKCQNMLYLWITTDDPNAGDGPEGQIMSWRVGKIRGASGLYLAQVVDCDGTCSLRLGKMIDNVLVFKYKIYIYYDGGELDGLNKWKVESSIEQDYPYNGGKRFWISTSKDLSAEVTYIESYDGSQQTISHLLDLTKVTEPMVYTLFKEEIDKNRVYNFYLTSFNFTDKWGAPVKPCV